LEALHNGIIFPAFQGVLRLFCSILDPLQEWGWYRDGAEFSSFLYLIAVDCGSPTLIVFPASAFCLPEDVQKKDQ